MDDEISSVYNLKDIPSIGDQIPIEDATQSDPNILKRGMLITGITPNDFPHIRVTQLDYDGNELERLLSLSAFRDPNNVLQIPVDYDIKNDPQTGTNMFRFIILDGHHRLFAAMLIYPHGPRINFLLRRPLSPGPSTMNGQEVWQNIENQYPHLRNSGQPNSS